MKVLNKLLNRINLVAAFLCLCFTAGCQSRQLSWLGAQNGVLRSSTSPLTVTESPTSIAANQPTANNTQSNPAHAAVHSAEYDASQASTAPNSNIVPAQYAASIVPSSAPQSVARVPMPPTQFPVPRVGAPQAPPGTPAQYVSHTTPHTHSATCGCNHGTPQYRPYFPRLTASQACSTCGLASCSGQCSPCEPCVATGTDPQEFIFDGGDHDPKVRLRSDLSQVGLDPEDTVVQYETADGKTNVESGCRVAIYAPRFASVRKIESAMEKELAMRPRTTDRPDGPGILRDHLPSTNLSQPLKSLNNGNVRVVESIRDRNRPMPSEMLLPMVVVSDSFKPFEDLSLIRNGDLKATDPAKLARATEAARAWTGVEELQVIIDGQEAIELTSDKRAAEVRLYEFKGARIRLCKVASEQMANPGDIISFTIRFDNVGEQPLKNLVITDSLAPRLEYVDKSQQSSIPADFSISPNDAGSSVLRWELEEGLKAGDGGLVRFSCKVR